jgi:uncharacterized protein (TIGR03000 family)
LRLTVRLVGEAELELEETKVNGSGSVRVFEIPALELGREYTYRLRATWTELIGETRRKREVKRRIQIRGGADVEVDLFPDDGPTNEERTLFELVNQERQKAGVAALVVNSKLMRAARGHSANMAHQNVLDHTLDGKTFDQRIAETGYLGGESGENCAQWAPTPAAAMQMWMNSDGHRGNILNPVYKEIGLGVAVSSEGKKYWTQVFAVPIETPMAATEPRP